MLITKNRQDVIEEIDNYASDVNIKAVGMLGFHLEQWEIPFFKPEDYLRQAVLYYRQFMDKIVIHYNIQINSFPQNREEVYKSVPTLQVNLEDQELMGYLQNTLGDIVDIIYFDTPYLEELEIWYDHIMNQAAITAADYKAPSMPKMHYWLRYVNTYFPIFFKFYGIVPKPDLPSASTGRITMNHMWRNGVTICLDGNQVPDYGRMIISPYYRNTNGLSGSEIYSDSEETYYRAVILNEMKKIDTNNWESFDPNLFVYNTSKKLPNDIRLQWQFADFNRMIRVNEYIPRIGSFEIIIFVSEPGSIEKFYRESIMINCHEDKFFDLNNEVDFEGTPTNLEQLKNNFSVKIIDNDFVLPTSLTTEAIEPIKVF